MGCRSVERRVLPVWFVLVFSMYEVLNCRRERESGVVALVLQTSARFDSSPLSLLHFNHVINNDHHDDSSTTKTHPTLLPPIRLSNPIPTSTILPNPRP